MLTPSGVNHLLNSCSILEICRFRNTRFSGRFNVYFFSLSLLCYHKLFVLRVRRYCLSILCSRRILSLSRSFIDEDFIAVSTLAGKGHQAAFGYQVYFTTKQFFQVFIDLTKGEKTKMLRLVRQNQDVDIGVFALFATRIGAKKAICGIIVSLLISTIYTSVCKYTVFFGKFQIIGTKKAI